MPGPLYNPLVSGAQELAWPALQVGDAIDFPQYNPYQNAAKFFGIQIQDEILGLRGGSLADKLYMQQFACPATLEVGQPVRLTPPSTAGDFTLDLATAQDVPHAAVIGFVRHKGPLGQPNDPASSICFIQHFLAVQNIPGTMGSEGHPGSPVYLQNDGTFGWSPGNVAKVVGTYLSEHAALLFASPAGSATGGVTPGSVTSGTIAPGAVTSGTIAPNSVLSGNLAFGSVNSGNISSGSIGDAQIASGGLSGLSGSIASGSIGFFAIASGGLASGTLASGSIGNAQIASGGLTSGAVASGSIGRVQIASGGLTSGAIASGSVDGNSVIASGTITNLLIASGGLNGLSGAISSGSISSGDLASGFLASLSAITLLSGQVTSGFLGDASVVAGSIASGSVGTNAIASGGINGLSGAITSGTISSGDLASGLLFFITTGATLLSGQVTSGFLGNNAVVSGSIASGQIGPFAIASGAIGSGAIQSGAVQGSLGSTPDIASGTIGPFDIGSGAIVSGAIASGQINSWSLGSGAVTAIAIASGQIQQFALGSGAITSGQIASGQISQYSFGSGAITSGAIASGAVGQFQLASGAVNIGQLGSGAVTAIAMGSGAVTSGAIASGQVGTTAIASGALTSGLMASGFISSLVANLGLQSGQVTSGFIGNAAITEQQIASGSIVDLNIFASGLISTSTNTVKVQVNQIAHGFTVGQAIYATSSNNYALAQANSVTTAEVIGVVDAVYNVDNFEYVTAGAITGLSGLVDGSVYYLSDVTPGLLTPTDVTTIGNISKPVMIADSTTAAVIHIMRGSIVSPTPLLQSGNVTSGFLGNQSVCSGSIASGQIGDVQIASGGLHGISGSIASGTIGNNQIVSGGLNSGAFSSGFLASLGASFVIQSGQVISGDIGNAAVVSGSIASGQVSNFALAANAVLRTNIASGAVTSGAIASGQIGQYALQQNIINGLSGWVTSGSIGVNQLASGVFTNAGITSGNALVSPNSQHNNGWVYNNVTTPPDTVHVLFTNVRTNSNGVNGVSTIWLSVFDVNSTDVTNLLKLVGPGTLFSLTDGTVTANYIVNTNTYATPPSGFYYFQLTVQYISSSGGTTFTNGATLTSTFSTGVPMALTGLPAAPAVSTSGNATIYFDNVLDQVKVSENGGTYQLIAPTLIAFPNNGAEFTVPTSLTAIPNLVVNNLLATKAYKFDIVIFVRSVGSGHYVGFDLAGGSGAAAHVSWNANGFYNGNVGLSNTALWGTQTQLDVLGCTLTTSTLFSTGAGGGQITIRITGYVQMATNGSFQPRIYTDSLASNATVANGCMMILTPLN